jgi:hypothetical protein
VKIEPTPPRARASWYAISRSVTFPREARPVPWAVRVIRL